MSDEVRPVPETLMLFDRQDDAQVVARLRGAAIKEYVYAFKQQGLTIYGLGVDGAEACKRELARDGEVIRPDGQITIMYQDADRAYFQVVASRWAVKPGVPDVKLDSTVELKNQAKFITRRDGTLEPDAFWLEKGGSKVWRNAILNLTPEEIKQRVIAQYKAVAKVVEFTPEVNDAMGHEAHRAFNAKDEHAALVTSLRARWLELEFSKDAVKKVLRAKHLPESLASDSADWSTVDLAMIQDLLKEAGA